MPEELLKSYTYTIFKARLGYMGIVKTLLGLHTVILPKAGSEEVMRQLKKSFQSNLVKDDKSLKNIKNKFLDYFSEKPVRFDEALDLSDATDFEKRVWSLVCTIPRGQVHSYDFVAKGVGEPSAKRAVGQALARNRLPIVIPCHRVVQKSGDIGGFSFGVDMKRKLLRIEGRVW